MVGESQVTSRSPAAALAISMAMLTGAAVSTGLRTGGESTAGGGQSSRLGGGSDVRVSTSLDR